MVAFRFNFIDIFRAPRLAFSAKKVWIQLRALALALVLYNLGAYGAFAVSGEGVYRLWSSYYLFPPLPLPGAGFELNAGGSALWALGLLAFAVVVALGMTSVAKVTVEQLRGNDFFSRREAGHFVRRHWRPVVFAPAALAVAMAALFACGLLVGLIGKIPWFGEVFASLTVVLLFLGALLFLFLALAFAFSFYLAPAVVATTGDDTFETAFEIFSTLNSQSWRLVLYEVFLKWLVIAAGLAFAVVSFLALKVAYGALYIPMGAKAATIFAAAWRVMPVCLRGGCAGAYPVCSWLRADGFSLWGRADVILPLPWSQAVAATFVSLAFLVILGVVWAYALNVHTVGQTIIYTVLRKKKDDENLLEMYDDELEQAMMDVSKDEAAAGGKRDEGGTPGA